MLEPQLLHSYTIPQQFWQLRHLKSIMDAFSSDPASFFADLQASGSDLPIPQMISVGEARRQAQARSTGVLDAWDTLRNILARHEATIQNRWLKKGRQQKLKILLTAWPDMSAWHRPEFQAFRIERSSQREQATRYRDAYMWPYINQQDLSKPRTLLLMLNSRKAHPSAFAAADGEAMHMGIVSKAVIPIFLNEYTMILNGVEDRSEYGRLLSWDDHPDAFDWMYRRVQFIPGEALLVLEAQERLMEFLVECCKLILHDIPADVLTSSTYPPQPEPSLKSEQDFNKFDSLTIMALEGPYRVPANMSLTRIEELLQAATASRQDHIWALREDPSYFHEQVLQAKDHRQETLSDAYGDAHPVFKPHREHIFWHRILTNIIADSYLPLEVYAELSQQAQDLRILQENHAADIKPGEELPKKYLDAILRFRHYLLEAAKGPMGQLKHNAVGSPPLRRFFVREPPDDPESSMIRTRSSSVRPDTEESYLIWLLQTLWDDGNNLFLCRLPAVVDELQRLIDTEKKAADLISDFIEATIADLAILSECLRQLETYQPWANNFEEQYVDQKDAIMQEFAKRTRPWGRLLNALGKPGQTGLEDLGKPSNKKFDYPVSRRRNKENVEQMRHAEANLDAFWAQVDRTMSNLSGTAVGRLLAEPRLLNRTPEWSHPPKIGEPEPIQDLTRPLSELYLDLERRTSRKSSNATATTSRKAKVKTRGTPQTPTQTNDPDPDQQHQPLTTTPSAPIYAVDARALKVFRTLLFTPSPTATPGEIPWTDFVHALVSLNFTAEKLYGSVWQFTPPAAVQQQRSIHIHEPHPGKIPFHVARRHGRRLERAYGWHGGMFTLRANNSTSNATGTDDNGDDVNGVS